MPLVMALLLLVLIGCVMQIVKDARIPKCRTCRRPRAHTTVTCLHCGAH